MTTAWEKIYRSYDDEILADLLPENDPVAEAASDTDEDMLASLGALIADNDQIQPDPGAARTTKRPASDRSTRG